MAEEVRLTGGPGRGGGGDGDGDGDGDERVSEWELGLPNIADLTPLSQSLISSEMLSAFSISPEPYRNMSDVNRASQNTLSDIRGDSFNSINNNNDSNNNKGNESVVDLTDSRKLRRVSYDGDGSGGAVEEIDNGDGGLVTDKAAAAAGSKRQRLVWTPQLHKRFIEVVGHLGVKNAVPKTIMNLMNVEGLSRENVASHLQKYRLYLKRMQSGSSSSSDHVIAAAAPPQEHQQMVHMQFPASQMVDSRGFEGNSYPYYNMTMQQMGYQHRK